MQCVTAASDSGPEAGRLPSCAAGGLRSIHSSFELTMKSSPWKGVSSSGRSLTNRASCDATAVRTRPAVDTTFTAALNVVYCLTGPSWNETAPRSRGEQTKKSCSTLYLVRRSVWSKGIMPLSATGRLALIPLYTPLGGVTRRACVPKDRARYDPLIASIFQRRRVLVV